MKLVVVSALGQGIVRNIVREKSWNFIFEFEWEPCYGKCEDFVNDVIY